MLEGPYLSHIITQLDILAPSKSLTAKQELSKGSLLRNQLINLTPEAEDDDMQTYMLDEALKCWDKLSPPFIDYAIPETIRPGDRLEVWKASDLGAPVQRTSPKTYVTCQRWKNSNHKYWTWDCNDLRYIVGGISEPNSRGYFSWLVWHGQEHKGFTGKRQLWTRLDTQGFTPKVEALQEREDALGRTVQFHEMREADKAIEKLARESRKKPKASLTKRQRELSPSIQLQDPLPTTKNDNVKSSSRPRKRLKCRPNSGNAISPVEGDIKQDAEDGDDSDIPLASRQRKQLQHESRSQNTISPIESKMEGERYAFDSTSRSSMQDPRYSLHPALTPATTVSSERPSSTHSLAASPRPRETISISSDTEDDEISIKSESGRKSVGLLEYNALKYPLIRSFSVRGKRN